jgi:hypothetical protein
MTPQNDYSPAPGETELMIQSRRNARPQMESQRPSDAADCSPSSETDNDTEAELAAWELLRDTRAELEDLRDAVRNMRNAKGRFHTQLATERLIGLLPANEEVSDRRAHGNENTTGANGGSLH